MSAVTAGRRRANHETYLLVFSTVYAALATNVLLILGAAPLVVGLVTTDPYRSWPLLALVAPLAVPGLVAAFGTFAAVSADPGAAVVRTFVRTWRAVLGRSLALGALTVAALVVLGVDVRALWSGRVGAVAVPCLTVLLVLAVATALHAAVLLAERPTARLAPLLKAACYLAVRRWYLTVVSIAITGLLVGLLAARPAIALGVAAAPLLYAVWANTRYALRPVLGSGPAAG